MTGPLFETDSVTKRFGGLTAVDDVSMSVQPGQVFGIAGPNGAGKTTFFDVVTGMTRATSGEVTFRGETLTHASVTQICHRGIARTFQHPVVFDTQTVLANAVVGAQFGGGQAVVVGHAQGPPHPRSAHGRSWSSSASPRRPERRRARCRCSTRRG